MNKLEDHAAITPVRIKGPQPASLCSVDILKYVRAFDGTDKVCGRGTGFHYRDLSGNVWLVTNWHVLTSRRPDDPSLLIGDATTSPHSIRVAYQSKKAGQFLPHLELPLYDTTGQPLWYEYDREKGIDLAAVPIGLPEEAMCPCVQDFAKRDSGTFVPGLDLTIVGMAFPHSRETPYPIWKSARVASEPAYLVMGVPQVLVDSAGVPGMSGSPVYRISRGITLPLPSDKGASDLLVALDTSKMEEVNLLNFVGVYAGSTGNRDLDKLSLGRMFIASLVDLLILERHRGVNPFPPAFNAQ
jgi:hypothetical protein